MPTEVFLSGIVHLLLIAGATALPQPVLLQPSRGVRIALGLVAGAASTLVALQGMPLGPVHTIFARCVAIKKGQAQGAKRSWGATPARLGNAANGPF
ncbi:hypothetical protein [Diaphorobacter sp. LR2014-1]|uniref:hypothetical protein n=1 Tax=Diaphorobacter sp. LR2014-1 TaxID=1933219 RepID=UPI0011AF0A1C|nr:hypothetical protein [Diaphorobacter sp. LR2014-1]